jgi:diguanylate cyclase (GGDEF)-like protein
MIDSLENIDLDLHLSLLAQLLGNNYQAALVAADEVLAQTPNFPQACIQDPNVLRHDLQDHLKRVYASLLVAPASYPEQTPTAANVDPQAELKRIAQLLQNECQLNTDIDSLTDELVNRYEDLNLVFDNQEITSGLIEFDVAMEQLVSNALSRQEQGVVILLLPSKEIEICKANKAGSIVDLDRLQQLNRGEWWSYLKRANGQWINNHDDAQQADGVQLVRDHNCKLLLSPITLPHGEVVGSLCFIRAATASNFSNGDRNMAEVLCQNALTIFNANFDVLTGLIHRSAFEKLVRERSTTLRNMQPQDVLLLVNVDRTQLVNDSLGHTQGDLLIKQVAKKIQASIRRTDIVSRFSGDEFSLLLLGVELPDAQRIANMICRAVQTIDFTSPASDENRSQYDTLPRASVSIGITLLEPRESTTNLISQAEVAAQKAKELGGNQVAIFNHENQELVRRREQMGLVHKIQDALANDKFELFAQPIVGLLEAEQTPHFEILLRMQDLNGERIYPDNFLPAAERYSLMPQIDRWVVRNTIQALQTSSLLIVEPDSVCAINLSGQTLSDEHFHEYVIDLMAEVDIQPHNICFEITETTAINDFALAQTFIDDMKGRGFLFSLDDFGTGLSSFTYLQQMPVNYLKIDGSFVSKILADPIAHAMVKAIADVATAMDLRTVGEFVESEEIMRELQNLGIYYGQGYYFDKPMPLQEYFNQHLENNLVHEPQARK